MAATYKSQIMRWNWNAIVKSAQSNPQTDYEGETYGYEYLGSVLSLTPSGKYYMPWCSNFTMAEARKDEAWQNALEDVAHQHGGFIESGEGDPCDLYFVIPVEV